MREDSAGRQVPVEQPASGVDGIVFGYLEKGRQRLPRGDRFFAVAVEGIVLRNALKLIPDRHTDGHWFGPAASQFGDDSAKLLLRDITVKNQPQAAQLTALYQKYFGPEEGQSDVDSSPAEGRSGSGVGKARSRGRSLRRPR